MSDDLVHPSKITMLYFLGGFLTLIVLIGLVFQRAYLQRNYLLSRESDCNPEKESCFVRPCDGGDCEEKEKIYQKETFWAKDFPKCNTSEDCHDIKCGDIPGCKIEWCDEQTAPEGEYCSAPDMNIQGDEEKSDSGSELTKTQGESFTDDE